MIPDNSWQMTTIRKPKLVIYKAGILGKLRFACPVVEKTTKIFTKYWWWFNGDLQRDQIRKNHQLNKQKTSTVSPTITLNKQKNYISLLDPSWLMK